MFSTPAARQGLGLMAKVYGRAGHRLRLAQAAFRRTVPARSPEKGPAPAPDPRPFPRAIEAPLWRPPSEKGNTMTSTKTLTQADLTQFTGTEQWYRHALVRDVLFTDGVKYVADNAGAYWLIDEIAFAQRSDARVAAEEFQNWKLAVNADKTAVLTCDDGNGDVVFTKRIEFTDFPLDEIALYFTNSVILLPSEY